MGDEGIAGVLSFIGVKVNTWTIARWTLNTNEWINQTKSLANNQCNLIALLGLKYW